AIVYLTPPGNPVRHSLWPFVLPSALFALMAGFSGGFNWWQALLLLLLGAVVLMVGIESSQSASAAAIQPANEKHRFVRIAEFILALAIAAIGGWAAVL